MKKKVHPALEPVPFWRNKAYIALLAIVIILCWWLPLQ
jgi:hypothetical protein